MERKHRLSSLLSIVIIVIVLALIGKNMKVTAFIEDTFISGCLRLMSPAMLFYDKPQLLDNNIWAQLVNNVVPVNAVINNQNDDYIKLADNDADGVISINAGADNLVNGLNNGEDNSGTKNETDNNAGNAGDTQPQESIIAGNTTQNSNINNSQQLNESDIRNIISRNTVSGAVYDKSQLTDYNFVRSHFYTVTSITDLTDSILRPAEFIEKNLAISKDNSKPQILIFHTHSQEGFTDTVEGDVSTTIIGVGDYLTELLVNKYGYNVIHDTSVYDYVDGKLDRSKAYTYAENGIEKILADNPTIEVVIDLHRDGVADTTHLLTNIDGKDMARVMLFNGLSYSKVNGDIAYLNNPYRDDNLAMSLQMQLLGEAYYPGYLRNIYVNAYRYCLHKRGRSMLIEAGAQTNTVGEVKNAMEPLADILNKCLSGEKMIN